MKRIAVVLAVILDIGLASAGEFAAQLPPASSPPSTTAALPVQASAGEPTVILDVGNFCCPEYLAALRKSVAENWQAPPNSGGTTMIRFVIERNGQISNAEIEVRSGVAEADERALRAVRLAKLTRLPSGFRPRTLTVHLRFSFLSTRRAASTGTPGAEAPPGSTLPGLTTLGEFIRKQQLERDASPGQTTDANAPIEPGTAVQFDTQGVDFGPWIRRFIPQMQRNWFIPSAAMTQKGRTVVSFSVSKAGVITNVKVVQPSGVEQFDRAAFNAVLNANPLEPLPPAYPRDEVQFTVSFYYNERPPTK